MNRILGVDKAAQSISSSLPDAAKIIADKLPVAAEKLTANAPESLSAGAKALTENLPEALSQAARSLGESVDLKGIVVVPPPSRHDLRLGYLQTAAAVMIGAGVLIG
eukprot:CAMPEP_0206200076 /NCGR_PEP_ID=MMETSP0166-20121206/10667_1 /ASSEMBLY_ACC=CAM_ASM_000260 /TAXON_ID=95228 /ORGANISM="Vannella robusta, Strain DIVA3 518/3/11/1/6" /LENGTH=106 /DNA_ID=CAMNT_0053618351 /DNA_START=442 /DNA_END=759 /DNA_ORIENTATION=+